MRPPKDPAYKAARQQFDERIKLLRLVETRNELELLRELVGEEPFDWPHALHLFWVLQTEAIEQSFDREDAARAAWLDAMARDAA